MISETITIFILNLVISIITLNRYSLGLKKNFNSIDCWILLDVATNIFNKHIITFIQLIYNLSLSLFYLKNTLNSITLE